MANGGGYERASDPWVTISPNGDAYLMSLSVDQDPNALGDFNPDAMLVSKSTDGGLTWSNPSTLIRDANPRRFNDKNSITADPNDSRYVYAVWDRLSAIGPVFRGPTLFTRTTNGGRSWEEARVIYDPGAFAQTLGNQIAVRPQGELINIFTLIRNVRRPGDPLFNVSVMRSEDNGRTWSGPIEFERMVNPGVFDPDDGERSVPATRSAPATSSPTSRSTRTAANSTPSGRTSASPRAFSAGTTVSRSRPRPTAALAGRPP